PLVARDVGLELYAEAGLLHRQLAQLRLYLLCQLPRRGPPLAGERAGGGEVPRRQLLALVLQRRLPLFRAAERGEVGAALLAESDDLLHARSVLPLEPLDESQAGLDLVQPARAHLQALPA